ncbi:unnamed protein product [Linum trigynum]
MIVKGKRTKRQRQPSPLPFPPPRPVPISATAATNSGSNCNYVSSTATSSAQSSAESTCTEEEDMANCLILLAQGRRSASPPPPPAPIEGPAAAEQQRGVFVYQCKTCDRCFSSFQALGGHRASHKKPRIAGGDGEGGEETNKNNNNNQNSSKGVVIKPVNQKLKEEGGEELALSLRIVNTAAVNDNHNLPTTTAAVKPSKVHECAICGAGFSSGQALGGHMRRHRTVVPAPPAAAALTAVRNGLELDLNLPAPEAGVDGREPINKFRFPATGLQLVFSAANPLVDCHF